MQERKRELFYKCAECLIGRIYVRLGNNLVGRVHRPSIIKITTVIGYGSAKAGKASSHGEPLGAENIVGLKENLGMPADEIATVVTAIGNHDEGTGVPVNPVAAALIIADKSDVRRSRVRNNDRSTFDIHDRVNYSVEESDLSISEDKKRVVLTLKIDPSISAVMDYFRIFIGRMEMTQRAASALGLGFSLVINGHELL